MPLAPDLVWREHATTTAHVTEGGLAGAMGTTTTNTRDTGDSATGTQGHGRGLLAGVDVGGVRLAGVLVHIGVDKVDDVGADGRLEDSRERRRRGDRAVNGQDLHSGACGGHLSTHEVTVFGLRYDTMLGMDVVHGSDSGSGSVRIRVR